ncbi:4-diphosphocytidyl-2-C-methyl-D-erythritol kinase [hydrothermal vent metagenome]|uniref:4-(cytidine 5'-diphospho)-2-C-methyl-D-erythritol kinase n=1 Tax=hydrothermal vent metagenome TaxID=652676 RepID=A0A3B1A6U3_9ZZZZ
MRWPAPAKLNLFLHITAQREDGFHLLQTVFVLIDFADQLGFCITDTPLIELDYQLAGVSKEQDIIYRAARALQQKTGTLQGARITLEKNLPMGGGLGGGSSDAATTLLVLNHLWGCGLDLPDLAAIGLTLGADVPVFIYGQNAWAEGVGEQLIPVDIPKTWYLVLIPEINVSTEQIFSDPQLIRDCPPITIRDFLAGQGQNVCEPIVAARSPEVVAALKALADSGAKARMTGTGACVFAAFDTETEARQIWSTLSARWNGFIAQGLDHSPVHEMLKSV